MSDSEPFPAQQSAWPATMFRVGGGPLAVEVKCGVLSAQAEVDALAIRANALLMPSDAAARQVHNAAGKELTAQCQSLAPAKRNDFVVVTSAFELPNKMLFHCQGPVPRRHPMYAEDLAGMYRHVLRMAEEKAVGSIALEPLGNASRLDGLWSEAGIIVASIKNATKPLRHLRRIRFVMTNEDEARTFRAELDSLG